MGKKLSNLINSGKPIRLFYFSSFYAVVNRIELIHGFADNYFFHIIECHHDMGTPTPDIKYK